jgi:hypothetical protein
VNISNSYSVRCYDYDIDHCLVVAKVMETLSLSKQAGFEVLTAVSTKMAVFWVLPGYMALRPRRQPSSNKQCKILIWRDLISRFTRS